MTVRSIKSQTNPEVGAWVYTIELSDGSVFSIKTSYLSSVYQDDMWAILNKPLSAEEEAAFRFAGACFQAEQAALRLIARAEQTGLGLSAKLERRGHSPSCVRAVVSRLKELEILSDSRYAALWLQARLSRKEESPRHLIMALCNRGINRDSAVAALKSVLPFEGELQLLKKYIENSYKHTESDERNTTSFLKSKLKYEGFSPGVIQSIFD